MSKLILSCLFFLMSVAAGAQVTEGPQMADSFRQDGKIYVVITVIAIIFVSVLFFLVYLERKLKKLEDKTKQ